MQENNITSGNTSSNKAMMWVAIAEAVVIIALLINMYSNKQHTNELITQIEAGVVEKDSLNHEMELIVKSYDELKINNDTLSAQLEQNRAEVVQLMEQLKKTKAANRDSLKKYKAQIETMRSIMRSFVVQIDSLNTKNQELIAENDRLTGKLDNATRENRKLTGEKDSLQGRVKQAETLKAVGIKLTALNDRDKETNRVLKAQKFVINFTIAENEMTAKGSRDIYIRLAKPNGDILMNESSSFFNYQGKEIAYSAKKSVNYDGKAQSATVYVISREVLNPGEYSADIFMDGRKIGTGISNLD